MKLTNAKTSLLMGALVVFLTSFGTVRADLEWTGAIDNDLFNEGNWTDTITAMPPAPGSIDPNVNVNNAMTLNSATAIVDAGSFSEALQLGEAGGSLSLTDGVLDMVGANGANGLRTEAPPADPANAAVSLSGASSADLQFILDIDMTLNDTSVVNLFGGGNPVNLSIIDLQSTEASIRFIAETVDAAIAEHIENGKILAFGNPGVLGVNLAIESDGGAGSIVTAMVPEPSGLAMIALAMAAFALTRNRR